MLRCKLSNPFDGNSTIIRDCRISPETAFWLFPHPVKSTTYKLHYCTKTRILGFFDSLYFNLNYSILDATTTYCNYLTITGLHWIQVWALYTEILYQSASFANNIFPTFLSLSPDAPKSWFGGLVLDDRTSLILPLSMSTPAAETGKTFRGLSDAWKEVKRVWKG